MIRIKAQPGFTIDGERVPQDRPKFVQFTGLLFVVIWLTGCGPTPPNPDAAVQKMEVAGIVRGLNPAETAVIIEHEDVPGFMPSMTMPFRAKSFDVIEGLAVGDSIRFELVVTSDDSWIQDIRPISSSELDLPTKAATTSGESSTDRLQEGDALPEFQLVDQENRSISAETFAGKSLLITFIFTRCPVPNYCPLMSAQFAKLEDEIVADPTLVDRTRLLSISFDPEFDTPTVLAEYANEFTEGGDFWRFATGDPLEIEKLSRAFSVYLEPEGESISHGLCTALVDPDGRIRQIWRGNDWKPAELMATLRSSTISVENNAASLDPHQGAPTADTPSSIQATNP